MFTLFEDRGPVSAHPSSTTAAEFVDWITRLVVDGIVGWAVLLGAVVANIVGADEITWEPVRSRRVEPGRQTR